ncbi:MAG: acyl-CoA dehydrogenase family protein [Pseudomonadales bacterium]|nr:acyl-CoA dehydrogenase family protein [Pseudomonadales bacterium]MCP5185676.1 acyl-CoA dehydrogenase family protein [Pseudomonadales bacterium]
MPESLSPELLDLRERTAAFAREFLCAGPAKTHQDVAAESVRRGFHGMSQPRSHGGSEAGPLALTVIRETLASLNAPQAGAVLGPGPGLLANCGEPLRGSYLLPLLAGRKRAGFGFTEPDDAPAPTTAVEDGDMLVVTGQKSYVTGGGDADFINTLATIPGKGPAMIVIDTNAPGVTLSRRFVSLDGSHHAAFTFDRVRVPANHVIGKPGEGLPRALKQIGDTRLAIAASVTGTMLYAIHFVRDHIERTDRTGEKRSAKEGVRLRYADMRTSAFAARSMLYRTARLAERGDNIVNEAIACKLFSTEAVAEVVDTAIQLVGGQALVVGHPLEALYRQIRVLRLAEGASDVLRLNLVRGDLELGKGVL